MLRALLGKEHLLTMGIFSNPRVNVQSSFPRIGVRWEVDESNDLQGFLFLLGFPGTLDCKESAYNVGDPGLIPGLGISSGEGTGNPLQYSCLENSMDRGAWGVHGVAESDTTEMT